ncbi:hypothetical protein [Streptacidiphilus sp. EB129]|uniref:hypothetical protein n=1 Tax=Streptacidiphilus sp. EB129 TaxID=3156262 RepID=UPI003514F565
MRSALLAALLLEEGSQQVVYRDPELSGPVRTGTLWGLVARGLVERRAPVAGAVPGAAPVLVLTGAGARAGAVLMAELAFTRPVVFRAYAARLGRRVNRLTTLPAHVPAYRHGSRTVTGEDTARTVWMDLDEARTALAAHLHNGDRVTSTEPDFTVVRVSTTAGRTFTMHA